MESSTKTLSEIPNTSKTPSVIIDKGGKIIAFSSDLKLFLPNISTQSNFFDLFDEQKLLTLQRIFIDVRKFEIPSKDIISFKIDNVDSDYEVVITPLRSENNIYFLVSINQVLKNRNTSDLNRFWIATADIEKITKDKKILVLVEKIKLTYPFTFIEKAKVQKQANELDDYFWIKDTNSKFVLINEKYAELLGFKSAQLENKNEQDYLPKYLINLYSNVDNYIKDSTNAVIFEGIGTPVAGGSNRNIKVFEFPLCDLDNNVVAIIGFTQTSKPKTEELSSPPQKNIYKYLPHAIAFIDREFKLAYYSDAFVKILNLNEKINLAEIELPKIFEKGFLTAFEDYYKDTAKTNEITINYIFSEKGQLAAEIQMKKIFDENKEYSGTLILITRRTDDDFTLDAKAKMYEALIEHSPEAMFIYDIDNLKFLEVNEAALKLYGYKRNDFLNMDLTDLYAPEDIQTLIQTSDGKSGSGGYSGPWKHKKVDGTSILVELRRTAIEFRGKNCHLNLVRNVSDQAEVKKRTQVLEFLFENTNEPVILTDKDGFITEINEPVSKKLIYTKKDLETRPFISLVSDDYRAKVNKTIFHSGILKSSTIDVEIKKSTNIYSKATLTATPIKNYSGDIDSFCILIKLLDEPAAVQDISKTQEDVSSKIDPPFLSNIFHEIITPINVILGFTQELGESLSNPNHEQREAIDIIKENQKLLLQIMDNAVDYSTLEQKVIKLRPEKIIFGDIVKELKENTRKAAEDKKVELTYGKISSSLTIESDRQKFVSLINLFLKFAIQITKESKIYLSAYTLDENSCAVSIKDTQNAITPYMLKAFNEIFSEDEKLSRRNYGFSKFSVKLAKKLMEILSAKTETIGKDSSASEFAIVFPINFVSGMDKIEIEKVSKPKEPKTILKSPDKIRREKSLEITSSQVEGVKKPFDVTQLSCLYLEDQVDSQLLFKVQMKDLKNIEFAPSFESALPLLKTKKFDFIIMDINLQGEYNGLDALRIIQKMPGYQSTPIIASTAYMLPDARTNFIAAGFNDFISKPLLHDKVVDVLKIFFS